ncbi:Cyclin-L1 [Gracilariopsis chorda]|uniref:Cyclin-L1 n=1 Tax=Gracilariopsis chorda TaxID=448386 RepID=A0A2V3IY60_9FLOR|nr:Cyclin-L1 [Gracilariopsis chorda]|eukprot:PXF46617.1 Cyclin-L1 [Gracilariopsis chorda]
MLLHRFYTQVSIVAHSTIWAAGACILLSTKLADETRSLRHVVNVVYDRVIHRQNMPVETVAVGGRNCRRPIEYYGAEGYHWKFAFIATERHILKELGFRLAMELPHNFILIFVNTLRDKAGAPGWSECEGDFKALLQTAWDYANDLLIDQLCVREAPEALACSCISLATEHCEGSLPDGWETVLGSSKEECERLALYIRALYKRSAWISCYKNYSRAQVLEKFSLRELPHDQVQRSHIYEDDTGKRLRSVEESHESVQVSKKLCENENSTVDDATSKSDKNVGELDNPSVENGALKPVRRKRKRRRFEDAAG